MATIIPITDFDAPELDVYARLSENQLLCREHPEQGVFIAESPAVIGRALDAGCRPLSLLMEARLAAGEQGKTLLARCGEIPAYTAELDVLQRLTGFPLTRGFLCAMRRTAPMSVEAVCAGARRLAVLEDVMNPTNVGAMLLTHASSDPLYRRAIRVSMGTVFQVPWTWLPETARPWPELLRALGFKTAAMALREDSLPVGDARLLSEPRLAIVLGTEGDGLAPQTIAACDYTVRIPMAHGVDSLNVAAASAVAFYQLVQCAPAAGGPA